MMVDSEIGLGWEDCGCCVHKLETPSGPGSHSSSCWECKLPTAARWASLQHLPLAEGNSLNPDYISLWEWPASHDSSQTWRHKGLAPYIYLRLSKGSFQFQRSLCSGWAEAPITLAWSRGHFSLCPWWCWLEDWPIHVIPQTLPTYTPVFMSLPLNTRGSQPKTQGHLENPGPKSGNLKPLR